MTPRPSATARVLLDRHGRTYAEELGIAVARGTPSPLYRLLCAAMLMSARISSSIATDAARTLAKRGWRSPRKMAESTWDELVQALGAAGYTRCQERTVTMLGDLTEHLLHRYRGDLRRPARRGRPPPSLGVSTRGSASRRLGTYRRCTTVLSTGAAGGRVDTWRRSTTFSVHSRSVRGRVDTLPRCPTFSVHSRSAARVDTSSSSRRTTVHSRPPVRQSRVRHLR